MATVPIPQGATIGDGSQTAQPQGNVPIPSGASIGHPEEGITRQDGGSFTITPKDGESFADTMQRAANIGKQVKSDLVQSQTVKGLKEAPAVLAAAPVIGAVGAAGLAGVGEAGSAAVGQIPGITNALLQHAEEKAAEWATQYPHLIKLAGALGVPTSTAAVLGWLYHSSKSK